MLPLVRFFLGFMLITTSLFLILLVLIQWGRGGGLAGALGGMGGQSAFGTKAGDVFTKITVGVAAFWILLCVLAINVLGRQQSLLSGSLGGAAPVGISPDVNSNVPGAPAQPAADVDPAATQTPKADSPQADSPKAEASTSDPVPSEPTAPATAPPTAPSAQAPAQ